MYFICIKNSTEGNATGTTKTKERTESQEYISMCKGMALCVAYAANVGGTGSMSGTGPNIIMVGQADLYVNIAIACYQ